jgi:hypothetical protein
MSREMVAAILTLRYELALATSPMSDRIRLTEQTNFLLRRN